MEHYDFIQIKPRKFSDEELNWLSIMLKDDFKGKDVIDNQLCSAKVTGYCPCGCRSISIEVNQDVPPFVYPKRVPVEMEATARDNVPISFLLHINDVGYVNELEILRLDSSPINEQIDISKAKVTVNVE